MCKISKSYKRSTPLKHFPGNQARLGIFQKQPQGEQALKYRKYLITQIGVMCRTLVPPNICQKYFSCGLVEGKRCVVHISNATHRLSPKYGEHPKLWPKNRPNRTHSFGHESGQVKPDRENILGLYSIALRTSSTSHV